MRSDLPQLAADLGADERTLRRAVSEGLVRCQRPTPRQLLLPRRERAYLAEHWDLLSSLRRALRTEPKVRLAVVYGSVARGDDDAGSDVDLLVQLKDPSMDDALALAVRLERKTDREVDVARLDQVADSSPLLLVAALEEGRVLIDRDDRWRVLRRRLPRLRREAGAVFDQRMREARAAGARLMAG